ncbi:MAG: TRAP transporter substrate-binding protein DctP [Rhodospirillales bacterium]|nr:TRAP transporter substrate-binding protein DctP [Rhodospirillales bacterium]
MTLRGCISLFGGSLCALISLLPSQGMAQQKLIYATYVSEAYSTTKSELWFMDEVEKRTNRQIVFERYLSGSLLKASDLFPGLARGAADVVSGAPSAYNRKQYPLANVTLPFITDHPDVVTKAFGELFETNADLRREFESKNARVLFTRGYAENTVWSRVPIATAEEFKGKKIRAVLAIADVLEKLGAVTVNMSFPDAVEGVERGIVDGMSSTPFDSAVGAGLQEITKFGSDGGRMGVYAANIFAINQKRWNSLSKEHQKIISEVAAEATVYATKLQDEEVQKAAEKICAAKAKLNLKLNLFSDAETAKVREIAAKPIQNDWIKWASEGTKVDAPKLLADYIALVAKYEKTSTYVPGFQRVRKICGPL